MIAIWNNDGLDRYNGYEFQHYKFDKYDENSLPNNYIVDIIEDKYGYLWISTIAGLSRINPETDEIKNYYTDKNMETYLIVIYGSYFIQRIIN